MPRIHVFKGAGNDYGFTANPNGTNLPDDKGPWHQVRDTEMNHGDGPRFGVSSDDILDAVEHGNAYIASVRVQISDKPPAKGSL